MPHRETINGRDDLAKGTTEDDDCQVESDRSEEGSTGAQARCGCGEIRGVGSAVVEGIPARVRVRFMTTARSDRGLPRLVLLFCAAVVAVSVASATTVIGVTFRTLATEADAVFAGTVREVRPYRRADGRIWTAVRFGQLRWLAGGGGEEKELEFAGGRIGDRAEVVGGMPQFTVGQRVVLFVHDAPSASPVVGFHQGCFALRETDAGDIVVTPDFRPVRGVDGDELVTGETGGEDGMSLDAFAAAVAEMRRGRSDP
jgi:hypothetical protein